MNMIRPRRTPPPGPDRAAHKRQSSMRLGKESADAARARWRSARWLTSLRGAVTLRQGTVVAVREQAGQSGLPALSAVSDRDRYTVEPQRASVEPRQLVVVLATLVAA
jgi:hypothetical protein